MDLSPLARRFPGLERPAGGRQRVFADAPGGTQVPDSVIEAMGDYLRRSNANTHGAFETSRATDRVISEARRAGAHLVGASPEEIVFGQNSTTLAFALSRSLARLIGRGDELAVTTLDHDANIAPWLAIAEEKGAAARWVDLRTEDCTLDLASLEAALTPRTRIVAFTLGSNAVGTIPPVDEITRLAHDAGAIVVADGVHLAQHRVLDVRAWGVDVMFCSAYKLFGPHLGLMFARGELLEEWHAYKVRPQEDEGPGRWETGTRNHEALAGFIAAVDYLAEIGEVFGGEGSDDRRRRVMAGMDAIRRHEAALSVGFLEALAELPEVRLYGIPDPERVHERTPTFALRVGDRHPRSVAEELGRRGVFVWDGNYYALAIMERLRLEESGGAVRVGFCHYNSPGEVDRVIDELRQLA